MRSSILASSLSLSLLVPVTFLTFVILLYSLRERIKNFNSNSTETYHAWNASSSIQFYSRAINLRVHSGICPALSFFFFFFFLLFLLPLTLQPPPLSLLKLLLLSLSHSPSALVYRCPSLPTLLLYVKGK